MLQSYAMLASIVVEILIAEFLFAKSFARRSYFYLRFCGYGFVTLFVTFWLYALYFALSGKGFVYGEPPADPWESVFNLFLFLLIFTMTFVTCLISYKQTPQEILLCCSCAYAIQHISRNIVNLITLIPVFSDGVRGMWLTGAVNVAVVAALYVAAYFLLIRPRMGDVKYLGAGHRKVIISLVAILICIVMSRITSDIGNRDLISIVAESIYSIFCCALLLYVQFAVSENDNMRYEVTSMSELLRSERRQFELSKETIDLINIKCHDMKHLISGFRKNLTEESFSEIENAIMIYDSAVKTGNDALDVVLTENKLRCDDKGIRMTCCVNGSRLSFMNDVDIYSLFGNALSNAIESAAKVQDGEKRCISVTTREAADMLYIHIENYFETPPAFEGGLPVTDKNGNYHGFGMRSMERLANKYNGELSASISGQKFCLDILLPLP